VPASRGSDAYLRLRHLWIDPTRTRQKIQEFYHSNWETHISATLWENFAVLPVPIWLPSLALDAGLSKVPATITAANWSYGWVAKPEIMDVVVHYRSADGEEGVIVVEAKTPWAGVLKGKDLNPDYYLDHARLTAFSRRALVYLLDESAIERARASVGASRNDVGFLSWQRLAGIQMSACAHLDAPVELKTFVASAIQRHFAEFGIISPALAADYLAEEPSRMEVDQKPDRERQSSPEREQELWRLKEPGIQSTSR
jgi:hypothetical protein